MVWDSERERELEDILANYANFIRAHIQKFRISVYGFDVDDLVQEVKIKIWKALCGEKKIESRTSYIRKIVDTSVIDHLRKFKRDEGLYEYEKYKTISEQERGYAFRGIEEDRDMKELIGRAVEKLIESRRIVVRLYLMNMNIDEIARSYGWSCNKARNLLYRGLSDLKKILKNESINYED